MVRKFVFFHSNHLCNCPTNHLFVVGGKQRSVKESVSALFFPILISSLKQILKFFSQRPLFLNSFHFWKANKLREFGHLTKQTSFCSFSSIVGVSCHLYWNPESEWWLKIAVSCLSFSAWAIWKPVWLPGPWDVTTHLMGESAYLAVTFWVVLS